MEIKEGGKHVKINKSEYLCTTLPVLSKENRHVDSKVRVLELKVNTFMKEVSVASFRLSVAYRPQYGNDIK